MGLYFRTTDSALVPIEHSAPRAAPCNPEVLSAPRTALQRLQMSPSTIANSGCASPGFGCSVPATSQAPLPWLPERFRAGEDWDHSVLALLLP